MAHSTQVGDILLDRPNELAWCIYTGIYTGHSRKNLIVLNNEQMQNLYTCIMMDQLSINPSEPYECFESR
jgi:hypothetical protein